MLINKELQLSQCDICKNIESNKNENPYEIDLVVRFSNELEDYPTQCYLPKGVYR